MGIEHLRQVTQEHFGVEGEDAAELIRTAKSEAENLVSLHQLHHNLSEDEKAVIVGTLWKIAYAHGRLDKHENALILKISNLLYVSCGRVMRLKHAAKQAACGV